MKTEKLLVTSFRRAMSRFVLRIFKRAACRLTGVYLVGKMKIINLTRKTVIAQQAEVADSFFPRMVGLLGRKSLLEGEGLVITRCNSIHMFFMRFAIAAIFIDGNKKVVGIVKSIQPNRISAIYWRAKAVIELPVGAIDKTFTKLNDELVFEV